MDIRVSGRRFATGLLAGGLCLIVLSGVSSVGAHAADLKTVFGKHTAGSPAIVDHSAWTRMLQKHVKPGADGLNRVNYANFKAVDHKALRDYVVRLEKTDPAKLDKKEQFAFWANLYNAKTIDVVLDNYPVVSIRKISIGGGLFGALKSTVGAGGPWKAKIMKVSGQSLSLDDIEHGILRAVFKGPRVHYAVNCASVGCPNLRTQAFTGANLDTELDKGAVEYVNNPRGLAVTGGKVKASSIYQWFAADFGGNAGGVLAHARKYAKPDLKAKLEGISAIGSYAYDWALNDTDK